MSACPLCWQAQGLGETQRVRNLALISPNIPSWSLVQEGREKHAVASRLRKKKTRQQIEVSEAHTIAHIILGKGLSSGAST